jgi:hypothetical protein
MLNTSQRISGFFSNLFPSLLTFFKSGDIDSILQRGDPILVSTRNTDVLRAIVSKAMSFSTAVGNVGLKDVLPCLQLVSKYPMNTRLFAFENDFNAVQLFSQELRRITTDITTIPVMCDRICTSREIRENNSVNIICEDFPGTAVIFKSLCLACYPFTTPKSGRKRCIPQNVVLAGSYQEEKFYYDRKFSLLNGIHFTMAVYAYDLLLRQNEPLSNWLGSPLSAWTKDPANKNNLQLMIQARILKLIVETDSTTLNSIFGSQKIQRIYEGLKTYADFILVRISKTSDTVGRILNLNDPLSVENKYSLHFCKLNDFVRMSARQICLPDVLENPFEVYVDVLEAMKNKFQKITTAFECKIKV